MDVDSATVRVVLTQAEREKLMNEKRCFECRETGHIARGCTKRRRNLRNNEGNNYRRPEEGQSSARITEVKDDVPKTIKRNEKSREQQDPDLFSKIRSLSSEEREKLLDKIMELGLGFA